MTASRRAVRARAARVRTRRASRRGPRPGRRRWCASSRSRSHHRARPRPSRATAQRLRRTRSPPSRLPRASPHDGGETKRSTPRHRSHPIPRTCAAWAKPREHRFLPIHLPTQRDQLIRERYVRQFNRIETRNLINDIAQSIDRPRRRIRNTNGHASPPTRSNPEVSRQVQAATSGRATGEASGRSQYSTRTYVRYATRVAEWVDAGNPDIYYPDNETL